MFLHNVIAAPPVRRTFTLSVLPFVLVSAVMVKTVISNPTLNPDAELIMNLGATALLLILFANVAVVFRASLASSNLGLQRIGYLVFIGAFIVALFYNWEEFTDIFAGYRSYSRKSGSLLDIIFWCCSSAAGAGVAYVMGLAITNWVLDGFKSSDQSLN